MPRDDVDVTGLGIHTDKDAGPVHALALRQDLVEVLAGVDGEGHGRQAPVAVDVAQVRLFQSQLFNCPYKVACSEVGRGHAEQANKRVGFECADSHSSSYQCHDSGASADNGRSGLAPSAECRVRCSRWAHR